MSTETKHTPGPWSHRKGWRTDEHSLEIYPLGKKPKVGKQAAIAMVDDIYDEAVANARLIAAAPDLFEVAQYIAYLDEHGVDVDLKLLALARAAIAKALGN